MVEIMVPSAPSFADSLLPADVAAHALGESAEELRRVLDAAIPTMAALAEPGEAGNHVRRVQQYVLVLARKLQSAGLHPELLNDAGIGTFVKATAWHDIGNAGVPDRILLKPGPLDSSELEVIRSHPTIGRGIVEQMRRSAGADNRFLQLAQEIAYGHQERWDGSGYPQGLVGEKIPVSARLVAVADAYDALTSDRVYRAGIPHDRAVQHIFTQRGAHFDPDVVDALIEVQDELHAISQRLADTELDLQKKIDYLAKAIAESP